ncbi:WD40-repeat-containing domain protein [Hysterangium stoloniferum]|nr:WD40-repeat-containing domain protein [Hysterangium stoloniferum]
MSSGIYNHRTLQPTAPTAAVAVSVPVANVNIAQPTSRLDECLETVRREFELVAQDINLLRNQRDEYDGKIANQVNELNQIRGHIYQLEERHKQLKQNYEDEISRLRRELDATRQGLAVQGPYCPLLPTPTSPPQAAPPPLNPPPGYAYPDYAMRGDRERDRDRMIDRDRMERDRLMERERERVDRERDGVGREGKRKERGDRDRDRDRKPADYYAPPIAKPGSPHPSNSVQPPPHFHGQLPSPQSLASQQPQQPPFPPSSSNGGGLPSMNTLSSERGIGDRMGGERGLPSMSDRGMDRERAIDRERGMVLSERERMGGVGMSTVGGSVPFSHAPGSFPDEFDPAMAPPELKKEGSDWFAVFSKHVPQRRLDVNLVHTLEHESVVCCVRFSADGKYLATGCNRSAQIYDTKTGAKTCVLIDDAAAKQGDLYIRSLCFSPDGKYLATGAEDKQIRIWDIAKKRIRSVFDGHQQEIYSLDFSKDGRLIVSGSGDKTARIWDMETGGHLALTIADPPETDAGVTSVAMSPDGRLVAAGSLDTFVRLWDVQSGHLVERLAGHKDSVYSVAFTPDGKGLVSGSLDQTLKHWDLTPLMRRGAGGRGYDSVKKETGVHEKCPCTVNFTGHKDYVLSVAVSHDSQWVVSGSKDRCVQFWDLRTAQPQLMLQGHKNSVISIDLSPTGGMLATGSGDWGARLCTSFSIYSSAED